MERMLQYIWKHRLFDEADFVTTDGTPVFVIDTGTVNTDAGPDFFNAKIRIGNTVWVGNVEIHERSSDWFHHRHQQDKSYNTVILHVVRQYDMDVYRANREPILQAVLPVPEKIEQNINWLLSRDTPVSCAERLKSISPIHLSDWKSALLMERLERKTEDIFTRLKNNFKDLNEMFYITLVRNFGFGVNSDAFELLARSLPYIHILKHRTNPVQIEALFFGQAGLLEDESGDDYYLLLRREYDFLRKKYGLRPVDSFLFKKLRTRPVNFPHVRLAQIASIWVRQDMLFSKTLEPGKLKELRALFNVLPSEYWATHYRFNVITDDIKKPVGESASDIILINTVIPVLFAYGKYTDRPEYCDRALQFLEEIKPERNAIVNLFRQCGVSVKNAGDSQALIQLRREYCDRKKCLYCRIGYRMIGNS